MKARGILLRLLPLWILLLLASCADDNQPEVAENLVITKEVAIAVVLPMDEDNKKIWENTGDWLLQNIEHAQKRLGDNTLYLPKLEYYDENGVNLSELGKTLAQREDVKIVIGPLENHHVESVAQYMSSEGKPMITPCCTASEICRKFSGKNFFWSLCESDITELTMMLSDASTYLSHLDPADKNNQVVSLIASKGQTSNTYLDWFEYEMIEMRLNIGKTYMYYLDNSISTIKNTFKKALKETHGALLCAPASDREVKAMIEVISECEKEGVELPYCIFSNKLYSPGLSNWEHEPLKESLFGYSPTNDPSTGFQIRFNSHILIHKDYLTVSQKYAAQYYDALMISALALWEVENGKAEDYKSAVADIVADQDNGVQRTGLNGWDDEYLYMIYSGLKQGKRFDLYGASGSIHFDPEVQSSSTRTVYVNFMYNQAYQVIDYLTKNGTSHTNSNTVKWKEKSKVYSKENGDEVIYSEEATNKWALLVSSSTTWENYRHTADVLSVYRLLRQNNYPPENIIVVADKSLADNQYNPAKGTIKRWDNLELYPYEGETDIIDYQVDDNSNQDMADDIIKIKSADIFAILNGQESDHLPKVIKSDSLSNILVYWSGHGTLRSKNGTDGMLSWGSGNNSAMTTANLKNFLIDYQDKYRKMLWILEPCYSASLASVADNPAINHVLFLTSATGSEQSIANESSRNDDYKCLMSDLFTQNLVTILENNLAIIDYYSLYEQLVKKTIGSHPQVRGAQSFGLLSDNYPSEFFVY